MQAIHWALILRFLRLLIVVVKALFGPGEARSR